MHHRSGFHDSISFPRWRGDKQTVTWVGLVLAHVTSLFAIQLSCVFQSPWEVLHSAQLVLDKANIITTCLHCVCGGSVTLCTTSYSMVGYYVMPEVYIQLWYLYM